MSTLYSRGISPQPCSNLLALSVKISDGMGWEMIRAGAIAKQVMTELEGMGCDTKNGCPEMAETAKATFEGRSLADVREACFISFFISWDTLNFF